MPKPDPMHTIPVADRPNHAYMINNSSCNWTKSFEIEGIASKTGESVAFGEVTGDKSSDRGNHVGTMANGDKYYVRYQGTSTMKDGAMQTTEGKWSFTGGTGKLKGLKGSGTYKGTGSADGGVTFEVEGDYSLPAKK